MWSLPLSSHLPGYLSFWPQWWFSHTFSCLSARVWAIPLTREYLIPQPTRASNTNLRTPHPQVSAPGSPSDAFSECCNSSPLPSSCSTFLLTPKPLFLYGSTSHRGLESFVFSSVLPISMWASPVWGSCLSPLFPWPNTPGSPWQVSCHCSHCSRSHSWMSLQPPGWCTCPCLPCARCPSPKGSFSSPPAMPFPRQPKISRTELYCEHSNKTHKMLKLKGPLETIWSRGFQMPVWRLLLDRLQKSNMGNDLKIQIHRLHHENSDSIWLGWIPAFWLFFFLKLPRWFHCTSLVQTLHFLYMENWGSERGTVTKC